MYHDDDDVLNRNHIARLTNDDVDNHERFHLRCVIEVTIQSLPVVMRIYSRLFRQQLGVRVDYARHLAEQRAVDPRRVGDILTYIGCSTEFMGKHCRQLYYYELNWADNLRNATPYLRDADSSL